MGNTRHTIENVTHTSFDNVNLLYISTSKYEGDWQSILHSHTFSELFYVVNGKGTFIANGVEFPIQANDLIIVNPHIEHTEKSFKKDPLDYIVLGVENLSFVFDDLNDKLPESMKAISKHVHKFSIKSSNFYAYLNIMLEEITEKQENYDEVCHNLLEVLLICLLRNENIKMVESTSTILKKECFQIKDYIDAHYYEDITLDDLAKLTHLNKFYVAHAFTKNIGMSPINYLLQRRIEEGKSLLISSTLSVADISSSLGFSSQSYFSQAFKKMTGISPRQYRMEYKREQTKE